MASSIRNRTNSPTKNNSKADFTKVGGLGNHIRLLREIIILPLLYGEVYNHFNIKAPRGVIFHGPPGTGKTLVAGALATELNKEGYGKVSFFQRKGADILDKWVGESEKKLRDLFDKAMKCRPSVIFFDELDGLAPTRSQKNDQVHASVVATLLALMDGLDNKAGVIVIGATNRLDALDGALRRPGRFDRELYFPLPCVVARADILRVHMNSWEHRPTEHFLTRLAQMTAGCCGSDLQALCAEAVMCALKRQYPAISTKCTNTTTKSIVSSTNGKVKVDLDHIKVQECDFLKASVNLVPTNQRFGNSRVRGLSAFIKPLLQRQLDNIMCHIKVLLPHFTHLNAKYTIGSERYAGRIILKGTNQQGLHSHVVPALLQCLEHLPNYILDIPTLLAQGIKSVQGNLPSILVLARIDDWWDLIDHSDQIGLAAMLEDLHAGLPILLVATCCRDVPDLLRDYFQFNSSIVITLDDPNRSERKQFFQPLFFGECTGSLFNILLSRNRNMNTPVIKQEIVKDADKQKVDKTKKHQNNLRRRRSNRYRLKGPDIIDSSMRLRGGGKENESSRVLIRLDVNQIGFLFGCVNLKEKRGLSCSSKEDQESSSAKTCSTPEFKRKKQTHKKSSQHNNVKRLNSPRCQSIQECCKSAFDYARQKLSAGNCTAASLLHDSPHDGYVHTDFECSSAPRHRNHILTTLTDLVNCSNIGDSMEYDDITTLYTNQQVKDEPMLFPPLCEAGLDAPATAPRSDNVNVANIDHLWHRTSTQTSEGLSVGQLELLFDTLRASININKHSNFDVIVQGIETTLNNFENSCVRHHV